MSSPGKSPLDRVVAMLGSLTQGELRELRQIISDLLEIEFHESETASSADDELRPRSAASGHIELKFIRGYGPYKYMRRWRGKTLTSTYLGKARNAGKGGS